MDWRNRPASVRFYIAAVVGGGVGVYVWALYRTVLGSVTLSTEDFVSLVGILLVSALSARWVVRIPRTTNWMAVADCLIIAIVMIFGLAPGIVAHGLFNLVSYWFAVEREPQEQGRVVERGRAVRQRAQRQHEQGREDEREGDARCVPDYAGTEPGARRQCAAIRRGDGGGGTNHCWILVGAGLRGNRRIESRRP